MARAGGDDKRGCREIELAVNAGLSGEQMAALAAKG